MSCEWVTTAEHVLHTYEVPRNKYLIELSEVLDSVKYRSYLAVNFAGDIKGYEVADHST